MGSVSLSVRLLPGHIFFESAIKTMHVILRHPGQRRQNPKV